MAAAEVYKSKYDVVGYWAGVTYGSSLWLVKHLLIGWLINIPPFFGFQFGRRSWPRTLLVSDWQVMNRSGFRHVQHVRPNRGPHKKGPHKMTGKFLQHSSMPEIIEIIIRKRFCVARWRHSVKSSGKNATSIHSVLCEYNYVMRVLNKMSMMTTLSLCVSCEFSRAVFVY